MTLAILSFALGLLGYLAYRQIGWIHIAPPDCEEWRAMLDAPDEPAMPPRRNRRVA